MVLIICGIIHANWVFSRTILDHIASEMSAEKSGSSDPPAKDIVTRLCFVMLPINSTSWKIKRLTKSL